MNLFEILVDMWDVLTKYWFRFLVVGIGNTLLLSVITVIGGTIIGALLAVGRMSKFKVLSKIIVVVVEVVRGTPALLQLYIGYLMVPTIFESVNKLDPQVMAFICVAVALVINSAAYVSEIIRSGIEAVDKGQTEAARSLGLNSTTTMIKIVLPQAVKNILPALGNEFITVVKETSLASTFFVGELMTQYKVVVGTTFNGFPPLLVAGVIYLLLNFILSKGLKILERSLKAHA